MRGSDAGHASGQGLTGGQVDRQGLLSRQANPMPYGQYIELCGYSQSMMVGWYGSL